MYFFLFKVHQLILNDIMGYLLTVSNLEESKILNNHVPNTNLKF